jgi:hypothetical protein
LAIENNANIKDLKSKYFTNDQLNDLLIHYAKIHKSLYMPYKFSKKYNKKLCLYAFQNGIYIIDSKINDPLLKGLVKMIKRGYFIVR